MALLGVNTFGQIGSAGSAGEAAVWTHNDDERWNGTSRMVVFLAGHGLGPSAFAPNAQGGRLMHAFARTGRYVGCAIQGVGTTAWYRQAVIDSIINARTAGIARGLLNGPILVVGYSMNGGAVANLYKQHPELIAAAVSINGALDLDWAFGTVGHTPVASPDYHLEIDASYGSYAATAGFRIWDEPASFRGKGKPWLVVHATDDEVVPYSIGSSFVSAVNDSSVTLRSPALTGGHAGFWPNLPPQELVDFADAGVWT